MLPSLLLVLLLALVGCDGAPATAVQTPEPTPEPTVEDATWAEIITDGIALGMHIPDGWQAITYERGIFLAEHPQLDSASGVLVYCFVPQFPDLDTRALPQDDLAWRVLDHIAGQSAYVGDDASVTEPVAFTLGQRSAAYYMLSDGAGNRTMVLAMVASPRSHLLACNLSGSVQNEDHIRAALPIVLESIVVNGETIDSGGLDVVPDPLVFPERAVERTPVATDESTPDE